MKIIEILLTWAPNIIAIAMAVAVIVAIAGSY